MKLSEINLLDVGNSIGLMGAVYSSADKLYFCPFPEHHGEFISGQGQVLFVPGSKTADDASYREMSVQTLNMNHEDWERFVKQTDLMETEVLSKASDGTLAKIILRKSARQIDTAVQWKVFKRDGYRCRYCGNDDVPLSVDHLVTWADGGPSITDNLVAACKRCNKIRGDIKYEDWMRHPRYRETSKNLTPEVREANEELIGKIRFIPRTLHTRSR